MAALNSWTESVNKAATSTLAAATTPAVTTRRTTVGDVFLTPEGEATVTTVAGLNCYAYFIN